MQLNRTPVHTGLYVVMGVAGAGKSVIGAALAHALGIPFIEGDAHHSPRNVQRMAAGIPLTDAHRQQWLKLLSALLVASHRASRGVVISCSALKRPYRTLLRGDGLAVQFVVLHGSRALLADRLENRSGHFMPTTLLDSQLATLELPAADEHAWLFDVCESPVEIVRAILARIEQSSA